MAATKNVAPTTNSTQTPIIISYLRFSTLEQRLGDSERRQLDKAKAYAKTQPLELAEEHFFADHGKSAFDGTNETQGNLGVILEMIKVGKIPPGSIFLVENIDRISRQEPLDALDIMFRIVKAGITIHVLDRNDSYDRQSLNNGSLWKLIGDIERAYKDSLVKSERISAARRTLIERARNGENVFLGKLPDWLKRVGYKQVCESEIIPEAVAAIKKIFDLRREGVGAPGTAKILNKGKYWTPKSGKWDIPYINKLVKDIRLIGIFDPCKRIKGSRKPDQEQFKYALYPQVISDELFYAVQDKLKSRQGTGGRNGKFSNVFMHLAKCGYCGGPMHFKKSGNATRAYLQCKEYKTTGKCVKVTMRYDEVENTILDFCHKLKPERVLPNPDEQEKLCNALELRINGKTAERADLQQKIENLDEHIAHTASQKSRDRQQLKITQMEETIEAIDEELAQLAKELTAAEQSRRSVKKWTADLKELKKALSEDDPVLRQRLNSHLKELINKIEVFPAGYPTETPEFDKDPADTFGESMEGFAISYFPEIYAEPDELREFYEFIKYVIARRSTKEGRFLRIHFKNGFKLDAVPPGSLASGTKHCHTAEGLSIEIIGPDKTLLKEEFDAQQKKNCKKG